MWDDTLLAIMLLGMTCILVHVGVWLSYILHTLHHTHTFGNKHCKLNFNYKFQVNKFLVSLPGSWR